MKIQAQIWLTEYGVGALAEGKTVNGTDLCISAPTLNMAEYGYVKIGKPVEVEVDFPREEAIKIALAKLSKEETELRAKFQAALNLIEKARSQMLALTCDVEVKES